MKKYNLDITCKIRRKRKYAFATLWNCSNKLIGKKVRMLYLDVWIRLSWKRNSITLVWGEAWLTIKNSSREWVPVICQQRFRLLLLKLFSYWIKHCWTLFLLSHVRTFKFCSTQFLILRKKLGKTELKEFTFLSERQSSL